MGASGAGVRAGRALRLLLLLVMALAAVEYLFGSILDASPLRTYLYMPAYNSSQPSVRASLRSQPFSKNMTSHPTHISNSTPTTIRTNKTTTPAPTNITITDRINTTKTEKGYTNTSLLITKIMNGMKDLVTTENGEMKSSTSTPLCDAMPPDLGPITVNKSEMELRDVEKKYPEVFWGGRYAPPNCTARHKVAIIVPYRDREQHLAMFLNQMHPFLMKQQLEYGIFIIEQEGTKAFNRAKLFNVGFVEAQRLRAGGWQCFVFHDVDLLPLDERNLYSCPRQPRHMSAAVDKFNFKLLYEDLFGGVSAMTKEQFIKVNGFSNKYWGWGGEDDDMAYRIKKSNYHIARYKMSIARYAMLDHKPQSVNPKRYQLLSQSKNYKKDGLSNLDYDVIEVVQHHLFTQITVNIDDHS